MARLSKSSIFYGMRGKVGQFVIRQYKNRVVISAAPDMTRHKPTGLQKKCREKFAAAVGYAKKINDDPLMRKLYAKKTIKGESVFQLALKAYLKVV